jgi:hypothetical protein
MAYHLEGRLLEVWDCRVLCRCCIGEDPDNGSCKGFVARHFDKGAVNGVDVADRTVVCLGAIPGNVLQGNWKAAMSIDDRASAGQQQALLGVYTGKLGGPVGERVKLIDEVVSVEKVPITFEVHQGKGSFRVGDVGAAELEPCVGPHGKNTTLTDSIFATVPGSPAYVGKATSDKAKNATLGIDVNLSGRNAIQCTFHLDG